MARWLFCCLGISASCLFCASPLRGQNPSNFDKTKVLAEWTSLIEKVLPVRWERAIDRFQSRDGKPMEKDRQDLFWVAVNQRGKSVRYESQGKKQIFTNFWLVNAKYNAELQRTKGKDGWLLTKLKEEGFEKDWKSNLSILACPWMQCGNVDLTKWIADASFVITRTEPIRHVSGGGNIRVHFVPDPRRREWGEAPQHVKKGFIDFDSTPPYKTMGYEYQTTGTSYDSVERGQLEYDLLAGLPVLRKVTSNTNSQSKKPGLVNIMGQSTENYKLENRANVSDEEFRLSYYHLPEPKGVTWPKPTPYYLWFMAVGFTALILGFFLRRRLQKKSPQLDVSKATFQ